MVEMPFTVTLELSTGPGLGNSAVRYFNMASIFDPDGNLSIGQPRFHDQAALQYNEYTVVSSSISAKILSSNIQGPTLMFIHTLRNGEIENPPPLRVAREIRTGFATREHGFHTQNSVGPRTKMVGSYNKNVYWLADRNGLNAQRTPFGTGPPNPAKIGVGFYALSNTETNFFSFTIRMVYRILLSDRKLIPASSA